MYHQNAFRVPFWKKYPKQNKATVYSTVKDGWVWAHQLILKKSVKEKLQTSGFEEKQGANRAAFESIVTMNQKVKNAISFNRRKKSEMSYVALISRAILTSPGKKLTLSEIYQFIEKHFPEFVECRVGWKNTVRHNLSLHNCFIKGELAQHGKSCYWRVHPRYVSRFVLGDFRRQPIRDLREGEETSSVFSLTASREVKREGSYNLEENSSLYTGLRFPTYSPPAFDHFQYAVLPQLSFRYAPFLRYMARNHSPFCVGAKPSANRCSGSCGHEFGPSMERPIHPDADCFKPSTDLYLKDAAMKNTKTYQ